MEAKEHRGQSQGGGDHGVMVLPIFPLQVSSSWCNQSLAIRMSNKKIRQNLLAQV
jgi:hypothetical protein